MFSFYLHIFNTGIGLSTNCIYREDGLRQPEHEYEDQSYHFKCDEKTSMYGIFDGHDGFEVAKYALDTIAAEVLLNQLEDKVSDEDVKTVLKYASLVLGVNIFKPITFTTP